jgi:hypothetical protein
MEDNFDPDKYLAEEEFNPDAYLGEEPIVQSPTEPTQLESGLRGAVQGTSVGMGDELGASALAIPETIRQRLAQYLPGSPENVDKQLREQGFTGDIQQPSVLENYRQLRDTSREADKAAKEANPWTYGLSEVAGAALPASLVGVPASLGGAAALGAGYGAVQGLGTSEADLTKGEVGQAAIDTAIGAGLGGAIPVAGKYAKEGAILAAKGIGKVGEKLADVAGENLKQLGTIYKNARDGIATLGKKAGDASDQQMMQIAKGISNKVNSFKKESNKIISDGLKGDKLDFTDSVVQQNKVLDDLIEKSKLNEDAMKLLKSVKGSFNNLMEGSNVNKSTVSKEVKSLILPPGVAPKPAKPSYQTEPQDFFDFQEKINSYANMAQKNDFTKEFAPVIRQMSDALENDVLSKLGTGKRELVEQGFNQWKDIRTVQQTLGEGIGDSLESKALPAQEDLKKQLLRLSGLTTKKTLGTQQEVERGMKALERIDPVSTPSLIKEIQKAARISDISAKAQGTSESATKAGVLLKGGMITASGVGQVAGALKYVTKLPSAAYGRLKESTTNPKLKSFFGNMENKSDNERSALMFAAMQNPAMKEALLEALGVDSSSNNEDITQD